ncbi:hypothetical protein GCM10007385_45990 [Tateyamaria omphalii]|uniref:hypothetical protein n=1 Tax=Tateyamaria omphalii TaxID=299262 RepID=UPI00167B733E|nr:hypothetical protein [Tateyamaria omphalii]GGX71864.1 hypothetical protein GCM10007385_45990 [Tateyamaria omphalii]
MRILVLILALLPGLAMADDKRVVFYAPPALVESGLIKHIAPRFSLKTQVRVEIADDPAVADLVLGSDGRALFSGLGQTWHMDLRGDGKGAQRFADWLTSDVGRRTVQSFAPDGEALFTEPQVQERVVAEVEMTGDAIAGQGVSWVKCGRCHATERGKDSFGIGSTPSFFVMRTFEDWQSRFAGFYTLKPHAAFTQLEGVTDPFPIDRPSPIAPIELTLDDLEAILAYVAVLDPADLGKPLEHQ